MARLNERGAEQLHPSHKCCARDLGLVEYPRALASMREFTARRSASTLDELWFVQHPPVFTLGQAGRREHLLSLADVPPHELPAGAIPIVQSDRGGQVTYHGPGQLVVYTLLDLRRLKLGIRQLVNGLEESVISMLARYALAAQRRDKAPGVYVAGKKIASLGLRVRAGCSYHGLSLNVDVDLEPFSRINVCGYEGLEVTSLAELGVQCSHREAAEALRGSLNRVLGLDAAWMPSAPLELLAGQVSC